MIFWVAAVVIMLAAAIPVTGERLTRFATLTDLSVTAANARQVIDHFAGLRRWRLIILTVAVPLACFTDDPFYLVLGWCAVSVFRDVRLPAPASRAHDGARIYRGAWLLGLGGAVVAGVHLLTDQGATPARVAHAAIVIVVAAAVPLAARNLTARPAPEASDDTAWAEPAIRQWSTRTLYLSGTAIVLSGALLTPGQPPQRELPEYSMPKSFPERMAVFTTVNKYKRPTCPWFDQIDDPCRSWLVNGEPFPQAAPYVIRKGGAPQRAPFARSPDKKAVIYLDRRDRRMVYQDTEGIHHLTGRLADTEVPTPAFAGQNRYVVLSKDGTQITDTTTWTTVSIPGVRQVHDLNESGIVATTAFQVLVLDHRGKTRMSLPLRKIKDAPEDTYHLRPDGRRLVVIRGHEMRVETFAPETGRRVSSVVPVFPGDDFLDLGLGWSEQGPFLVRGYTSERVYYLDLATGKLRRREK
ncbi:hypothetical protein [Streptosporangium roseum]|uniref:Uncharacterized protein n=2 Tax=Streptosporangium roseum TaxID=2001 RepID=D2B1A4_STRRD|nr:hypothetical protein [Streptosporangium roseum]ACZ85369.1 hypothetical protein Sros_2390 [Streptosporangium roseum DSM 43021]